MLQTASVLGRQFPQNLLAATWEGPGILDAALVELKRLEFLYERAGVDEAVYVFKHALTQDVAYESMLATRRHALHAAAGRALETLFNSRLEEVYDRLAHHYARTSDAPKAVTYLTALADKMARTYANTEAVVALEEALGHVDRLPTDGRDRSAAGIVLRLAHSFYFVGRLKDTLELLLRHRDIFERLDDPSLTGQYNFWLGHTHSYLGQQDAAAEAAERALEAGRRSNDEATIGKAYYVLSRRGFWACRFPEGVDCGRRAGTLLERAKEWLWLGQAHWSVGLNHHFMGEFDEALEAEARAHSIGEATGDPRLRTYTDWAIGWIHATRGDLEAGLDACQRSLAGSRDAFNTACALGWSGFAYLETDAAKAIPLLEKSIELFGRIGYEPILGWFRAWLGDALRLHGDRRRAHAEAAQAVEIGRRFGNPYSVGLAKRVLGLVTLEDGELRRADSLLREALETFELIHSRFETARTHLHLVAISRSRGDIDETFAHLSRAAAGFAITRAPKFVERAHQLAHSLGVTL